MAMLVNHLRPKSSESGTIGQDEQAPDVVWFGFGIDTDLRHSC